MHLWQRTYNNTLIAHTYNAQVYNTLIAHL